MKTLPPTPQTGVISRSLWEDVNFFDQEPLKFEWCFNTQKGKRIKLLSITQSLFGDLGIVQVTRGKYR